MGTKDSNQNIMPYIAASPDGIAVCDCCDRSVIEFKCPFKIRGKTVHEAYKETDFMEEVNGALHLKQHISILLKYNVRWVFPKQKHATFVYGQEREYLL